MRRPAEPSDPIDMLLASAAARLLIAAFWTWEGIKSLRAALRLPRDASAASARFEE